MAKGGFHDQLGGGFNIMTEKETYYQYADKALKVF